MSLSLVQLNLHSTHPQPAFSTLITSQQHPQLPAFEPVRIKTRGLLER
jgi:hypothetical protein